MIQDHELTAFKYSLLFLHVNELKDLARQFSLQDQGNKMIIINRILHFFQTGQKLTLPKLPEISCAKKGKDYPLDTATLMLKGSYKNDLKTRLFFKKIIGEHFHFTAFGIDWLNSRWSEGNPPTYGEFAKMWQEEYQKRQFLPAQAKEEWAYINFVNDFLSTLPNASKECINKAWDKERQKHKINVLFFIKQKNLK